MTSASPILVFCDGACSGNPGPGGWGSIVATADEVREFGGGAAATTNNRMEMTAAMEALRSLAGTTGEIIVHTDSKYVIQGITQWIWAWRKRGWKSTAGGDVANRDLWEQLSVVTGPFGKSLKWELVPGHSGIEGNERCDEIAVAYSKGSRPQLYRGPRNSYPVSLAYVKGEALPKKKSSSKGAKAYSYVSLLSGTAMRHATWSECERRVKGQPNAKFRKATSAEDEAEILRSWGVKL